MPKNAEKKLLLFKIETTEGTDAAPVVGTDAIITVGLDASGLEGDEVERQIDGQYFGARPTVYSQIRKPVSFGVEVAGSGVSATTVPAFMKILRICGFDAGIAGGSSVVQSPISAGVPSATLWPFYDNLRAAALGSRANWTAAFEAGQVPLFNLTAMGFPPAGIVSESTPGTPTFTNQATPVIVNTANTTFSLGGFSPALKRLTINGGTIVEPRSLVGPTDKAMFRNRKMTAEALVEFPDLASKNYYTNLLNRTTQAMQLVHGVAAANIVQIDSARAEVGLITTPEDQGQLMALIPLRLLPSTASGNDELTFTSK
jgi:hypothetical protein